MNINRKLTFALTLILIFAATNIADAGWGNKKKRNKGIRLYNKAIELKKIGDYRGAARKYEEALVIFKKINNREDISDGSGNLGNIYEHFGDYTKALQLHKQGLKFARAIGDKVAEARHLNNIGIVYEDLNDYPKAIEYSNRSLELARSIGDKSHIANALANIGLCYLRLGNTRKSIEYNEQALEVARAIGHKSTMFNALNCIGLGYKNLGDYENALKYYEQALDIGDKKSILNVIANMGVLYRSMGNQAKALEYCGQALGLARANDDKEVIGNVFNEMGNIYKDSGKYKKSLEYHEQSLEIARERGNNLSISIRLNNIGGIYQDGFSNYTKAREYYEKALKIAKDLGITGSNIAMSLGNIGQTYSSSGNYQKALEYYERALSIYRDVEDKSGMEQILRNLGTVYANLKDPEKALVYHEQALKISRDIGDKHGIGMNLINIGQYHDDSGDYQKAIEYYERALEVLREVGDKGNIATVLSSLGGTYHELGNNKKALDYQEQSLKVRREIGNREGEGISLQNIGLVYSSLNDYLKALEYYEHSMDIASEIGYKRLLYYNLRSLGNVYEALGDYQKSLGYYERGLKIVKELGIKEDTVDFHYSIGNVYGSLGDNTKALEHYETALEIARYIGDKSSEVYCLLLISMFHDVSDNYQKTLQYLEKALGFARETGDTNSVANIHIGLGKVYSVLGNYGKALEYYEKALKPVLDIGTPGLLTDYYGGLGEALEGLDRLEDAVGPYLKAIKISEKQRSSLKNEKQKTGLLSKYLSSYKRLASVLARLHLKGDGFDNPELRKYGSDYGDAAFYFVENTKARSLLEIISGKARSGRAFKLPKKLYEEEQGLVNQIGQLNAQLADAYRIDKHLFRGKKEAIKDLESDLEYFVRELRKDYPEYAALKYPQPLGLKDIPLKPGEILLEYHVTEKEISLFVIGSDKTDTPESKERKQQKKNRIMKLIEIPISGEELREKVSSFRRAFEDYSNIDEFDPVKAKELYDLLLKDGVEGLSRGSHLVIIPDSILNLLPFEALAVNVDNAEKRMPENGTGISAYSGIEYFGDKWKTSYYQSATVLGLNRTLGKDKKSWTNPLFALGDPVFEEGDKRYVRFLKGNRKKIMLASLNDKSSLNTRALEVVKKGYALPRLEDTRDEVLEIGETLNVEDKSHIKLDMDASEGEVKYVDLSDYRYIHFATHGILGDEIPYILEPALVLNQVDNGKEDGYLTMSEVMGLDMAADMVALSACKTGLGKDVGGEGVVGLSRAFMYAGTPSVIVSLWSVASKSTTDFMTILYKYLQEGKDKAEALRLARIDLRQKQFLEDPRKSPGGSKAGGEGSTSEKPVSFDYSHPYFWAPFILVGEY